MSIKRIFKRNKNTRSFVISSSSIFISFKNSFYAHIFLKEIKILGVLLYRRVVLYRDTSKILGVIKVSSHKAVHYWYNHLNELSIISPK